MIERGVSLLKIKEYRNVPYFKRAENGDTYITIKQEKIEPKELEKFGFEYFINGCGTEGMYLAKERIAIIFNDKEFNKENERLIAKCISQDLLFDLIQAGLVEKVEEVSK